MSKIKRKQFITIKKLVKSYIDALQMEKFPVSRAFIYGSYARGDFKKNSDIDVCIISKAYNPDDDDVRLFLWQKRRDIDARIEPIGYSPEDFKNDVVLADIIRAEGIRVV
jgi:predicted nucleotidyltransferase